MDEHASRSTRHAVAELWQAQGLPPQALDTLDLGGAEPVLPSSFAVGTAAQASLGVAALAAAEVWHQRLARQGRARRQRVAIDMLHAALECCGHFTVDGRAPVLWDRLSGLYPCGGEASPGWVRLHANFAHHRDRALAVLGCPAGPDVERAVVAEALRSWQAQDFEDAVAAAGGVACAVRSEAQWDAHPQAAAVAAEPLVSVARIAEDRPAPPRSWPALDAGGRPLQGLRVLDLTRILAGPVAGRTLAAYGADVMLLNAPHLPNIEAIADTSRGKWSAHVDLDTAGGRDTLASLLAQTHVFLQGYRPGALAARGFGPEDAARLSPGVVHVSLSAYGSAGPWAGRRGFDSLVQSATGLNLAEARAFGESQPRALPMQILDYAAGYLLAFGAQVGLLRQAAEGGSWQVQVSLAGVGRWLRSLGRVPQGVAAPRPPFEPWLTSFPGGFGDVVAVRHAAIFSSTPAAWVRPAMPPGSHPPAWPG